MKFIKILSESQNQKIRDAKKSKKMIKEQDDINEIGFTIPAEYSKEPLKSAYTKYQFLLHQNNGDQKKTLEDIVKMQTSIKDLSSVENSEKHKLYLDMEKIAREMIGEQKIDEEKDPEGQMAKVQLKKISGYADQISKGLKDDSQLDAWVQDHIAKASELMDQVGHFMTDKKQ